MSDPVTTAKLLKQQRDEWRQKYEEEKESLDKVCMHLKVQARSNQWANSDEARTEFQKGYDKAVERIIEWMVREGIMENDS